MASFNHINGAEPSTVTFKLATVVQTRNSSVMHQEIMALGDPDTSNAIAAVLNTAPASTAWALATREVLPSTGPFAISSIAGVTTIQGNSTVHFPAGMVSSAAPAAGSSALITRLIWSSTNTDQPVAAAQAGTWTVTVQGNSTAVFPSGYISSAAQSGNSSGLTVRPVWSSSNADQPVSAIFPAGYLSSAVQAGGSSALTVRNVWSSTSADQKVRADQGVGNSSGADGWPVLHVDSSNAIVKAGDSANNALRVNVVAGAAGGSTIVTVSTGSVGLAGVYDSSGGLVKVADSANNAIKVNVVAGAAGGSTIVSIGAFNSLISSAVQAGGSSALTVRNVWSSTNADQPVSAAQAGTWNIVNITGSMSSLSTGHVTVDTGSIAISSPLGTSAPSSNASAVIVREVIPSLLTKASSNFFTSSLVAINSTVAGQKCKVYAYSITSTVQAPTKLAFYKGSSMIWPVVLAAISSAVTGANLAVTPPGYLFASAAGSSVTLRTPSSLAGFKVAVSYWMGP